MFYQFKGQTRRRKRSPLQRRKRNAYISETTRWTEGVIPYVVDTNAFSKSISNIPCAAKSFRMATTDMWPGKLCFLVVDSTVSQCLQNSLDIIDQCLMKNFFWFTSHQGFII